MKNIKYLAMLTAAAMLAACDPNGLDTVKTYPAEDIVAPTLQPMETVEVSQANYDENGNVTFSWTAADFGAAAGVDYSIYRPALKTYSASALPKAMLKKAIDDVMLGK